MRWSEWAFWKIGHACAWSAKWYTRIVATNQAAATWSTQHLCTRLALLVKHLPKEGRRKLAYIGSGPLPLTAICYERQGLFSEVIGIDADQEALAASRQVCSKLGSGVSFLHADATKVNYNDFSLIFGAALVGMTNDEKQQILQKIKHTARPGTLVAVRSAYGSRELLYSKHERTVVRHRRSISLRISVPTARLKGTFVRGAMRIWRNTWKTKAVIFLR